MRVILLALALALTGCGRDPVAPVCVAGPPITVVLRNVAGDSVGVAVVTNTVCR